MGLGFARSLKDVGLEPRPEPTRPSRRVPFPGVQGSSPHTPALLLPPGCSATPGRREPGAQEQSSQDGTRTPARQPGSWICGLHPTQAASLASWARCPGCPAPVCSSPSSPRPAEVRGLCGSGSRTHRAWPGPAEDSGCGSQQARLRSLTNPLRAAPAPALPRVTPPPGT